ncbi:MAG TPA: hypothetical protein VGL99_11455 [Chloroflexota bacterium]
MGSRTRSTALDRPVIRTEYGLELLSDANGNHTWSGGAFEVWSNDLDLRIVFGEVKHGDAMLLSEHSHCGTEGIAHVREQDRRRDRLTAVLGEKRHHLAGYLQIRNVRIQVGPVEALKVEHNVAIKELVDVADSCHHPCRPQLHSFKGIMTAKPLHRKRLGGPSLASLVVCQAILDLDSSNRMRLV